MPSATLSSQTNTKILSGLIRHPIQKLNFNPDNKISKVAHMASLVNVSKFAIKTESNKQ